ncbi:hypothetical protein HOY80DRAFT_997054 [Tuber brumale]|nr:hypothetical protein HOY80DRAFT_997054 [Tuber brumale]
MSILLLPCPLLSSPSALAASSSPRLLGPHLEVFPRSLPLTVGPPWSAGREHSFGHARNSGSPRSPGLPRPAPYCYLSLQPPPRRPACTTTMASTLLPPQPRPLFQAPSALVFVCFPLLLRLAVTPSPLCAGSICPPPPPYRD